MLVPSFIAVIAKRLCSQFPFVFHDGNFQHDTEVFFNNFNSLSIFKN